MPNCLYTNHFFANTSFGQCWIDYHTRICWFEPHIPWIGYLHHHVSDVKSEFWYWEMRHNRVLAGKIRQSKFRPSCCCSRLMGLQLARALTGFVEDCVSDLNRHARYRRSLKGKSVVVDDLVNTGASANAAVQMAESFNRVKWNSLLIRPRRRGFQTRFYTARKQRKWFVFPWRFLNDVTQLVTLFQAATRSRLTWLTKNSTRLSTSSSRAQSYWKCWKNCASAAYSDRIFTRTASYCDGRLLKQKENQLQRRLVVSFFTSRYLFF